MAGVERCVIGLVTHCLFEMQPPGSSKDEVTDSISGDLMDDFKNWFPAVLPEVARSLEPLPASGNRSNERRYKREGSGNDRGEKGRNGGEKERAAKKTGVVKRRHGWTMYRNLVTSQYILYFKKCPIEGVE
ncbi:hypothetical protein TNCV_1184111 [Trichonephila clavipes]|nr:hypothetical protein TNCV_1184111 [Trichonephila clavipes]